MLANFDKVLGYVLQEEGGYTNDPDDPGGPTNWGITIFDARKYWKPNATAEDVKEMPIGIAKNIYKSKYWNIMRCNDLPSGLDYSIMDYGVNSGIGRAGKVLRRALGLVDNTSVINDDVIAACKAKDPKILINYINTERLAFLQSLRTWPKFGRGWGARVARVKARSMAMAAAQAMPVDTTKPDPSAKGAVTVNKKAQGGTISGTVVTGGAVSTTQPWEIALIVVGVSIALSVGLYYFFKWRQKVNQERAVPVMIIAGA